MAVKQVGSLSLAANARSDWLPLAPGFNRVLVKSASWSGSSLAMKYNTEDTTNDFDLKDSSGTAIVCTGNTIIEMIGPGYIGGVLSSYGGTPVTVEVVTPNSVIGGAVVGTGVGR